MPVPLGIMLIMRIKVIYATIIFAILETVVVIFSVQDMYRTFRTPGWTCKRCASCRRTDWKKSREGEAIKQPGIHQVYADREIRCD